MHRVVLPSRTRVTVVLSPDSHDVPCVEIVACETRVDQAGYAVALAPRRHNLRCSRWMLFEEEEGSFWALGHDTDAVKALKAARAL